jgi:hypothetical protein
MPFTLDRYEVGKVLSGEASAVSRLYDATVGCPHAPGTKIVLTSPHAPAPVTGLPTQDNPIAMATITAVQTETVDARKRNERAAVMEGFESATAWYTHFRQLYGDLHDDTPITRLTFRIEQMYTKK